MKLSAGLAKRLLPRLKRQEKELLKNKKELENQDSFKDTSRVLENADVDLEVDEQNYHQKTEVLRMAIDRNLRQVRRAIGAIRKGKYGKCDICGKPISRERLKVFPTATLCRECREKKEREKKQVVKKKTLLTSR